MFCSEYVCQFMPTGLASPTPADRRMILDTGTWLALNWLTGGGWRSLCKLGEIYWIQSLCFSLWLTDAHARNTWGLARPKRLWIYVAFCTSEVYTMDVCIMMWFGGTRRWRRMVGDLYREFIFLAPSGRKKCFGILIKKFLLVDARDQLLNWIQYYIVLKDFGFNK